MIFDVLNQQIDQLKEIQRRQGIKENKQKQNIVDKKYLALVGKVNGSFEILYFMNQNLGFKMSEKAHDDLAKLFVKLKEAVCSGYADGFAVGTVEDLFGSIQITLRKDWKEHYNAITATKLSTLRVIGGIDPLGVRNCIAEIETAESWGADRLVYSKLKDALDRASGLIQSLDMDQEIIEFLQKMTNGKASIVDLNPNVFAWIQRENLQAKIKLSFTGGRSDASG